MHLKKLTNIIQSYFIPVAFKATRAILNNLSPWYVMSELVFVRRVYDHVDYRRFCSLESLGVERAGVAFRLRVFGGDRRLGQLLKDKKKRKGRI